VIPFALIGNLVTAFTFALIVTLIAAYANDDLP
jgi:hypothetical protein